MALRRLSCGQVRQRMPCGIRAIPTQVATTTLTFRAPTGRYSSAFVALLYLLLTWSYTTAVFTDPGSPLQSKRGYSNLPTTENRAYTSFTVKSSGEIRFCKKCQTTKPDRAHHCSTCRRCVLKMDHHCPWLGTCVGLKNYKAFLLFLIYLTLFCWGCFAISASWVWGEVLNDSNYADSIMPVNYILLAVLSGIIGIVIAGFTGWHIYLTATGTTTIEKLEKTRYLSPLRKSMQHHLAQRNPVDPGTGRPSLGDQLREIHANIVPGVTRPEEGEDPRSYSPYPGSSPAQQSLHRNYNDLEAQRERDRYADYMDEIDSSKLPNAFDLGWKSNMLHVFGHRAILWAFPICNTTGDGWQWEASDRWLVARDNIRREREHQMRIQRERERAAGWGIDSPGPWLGTRPAWAAAADEDDDEDDIDTVQDKHFLTTSNGVARIPGQGRRSPSKANQILGRWDTESVPEEVGTPMQDLRGRRRVDPMLDSMPNDYDDADDYDISSDEERAERRTLVKKQLSQPQPPLQPPPRRASSSRVAQATSSTTTATAPSGDWNDIPDDMFAKNGKATSRSTSRNPQKKAKDGENWETWDPK